MKIKILLMLFSVFLILFFAGCSKNLSGGEEPSITPVVPKTFDLSGGDTQPETIDLALSGLSQVSASKVRNTAQRWTATITVTVTGSENHGQQVITLTSEEYAEGGSVRLILPRGNKSVTVDLTFLENGMAVAYYHGQQIMEALIAVEDGSSAHLGPVRVEIALEQVPVEIGVIFMINISINIRDAQTSYGVPGAVAVFKKNGVEIQRVTVGENPDFPAWGKTVLPMQAQGEAPYTFEISHASYETLTGTIEVISPAEVKVNGVNTYGNLNEALTLKQ